MSIELVQPYDYINKPIRAGGSITDITVTTPGYYGNYSPPTPRFTFWGNWSLVKSCVSLKTATGAAWGTSLNTDMMLLLLLGLCVSV